MKDICKVSQLKPINIVLHVKTLSYNFSITESDDDDTAMKTCESSQSSTSCDQSNGSNSSEHLPNPSPLASQLANVSECLTMPRGKCT